jgi:hypothetical protein
MQRSVFVNRPGFVLLGLAFALGASSGVQAQVAVDVSKITCSQFVGYTITNPEYIAVWLSGYYQGKRGDTMIVDMQALKKNERKLEDYCLDKPDVSIIQAFATIWGPGK